MSKPIKSFDDLVKYTVAAIILVIPLYPKFPFITIPNTFVSVRLEDLLMAFAGILVLIIIFNNFVEFSKNQLIKNIILYLSVGLVSWISAVFVTHTVVTVVGFLHWLRRIEYFIPLLLSIYSIKSDRRNLDYYLKLFLVVIIASFIYGFGQRYLRWPIIITQNEEYSKGVALNWMEGSHINASFAGHYDLATFLILLMPTIFALFLLIKKRFEKLFMIITFLMGLWLLVNTASRVSLLSYMVGVSSMLFLIKKIKYIPVVLILSLLFVGFSTNLISRYERIFDVLKLRVENSEHLNYIKPDVVYAIDEETIKKSYLLPTPTPQPVFEDRSTNIRFNVEWPRAIRAFEKDPLLGTGYSSITLASDNDYLRSLGETGLLGFVAFSLIFIYILVLLMKKLPYVKDFKGVELAFIAGISGSLPGIFMNAFFIDVFEASKFAILFWLIIGLALGTISQTKYE